MGYKKPSNDKPPKLTIDDIEGDAREEQSEILKGFKESAKREAARFADSTDGEYYCVLCFQSKTQKDEYLQKAGLTGFCCSTDVDGLTVLDGMKVAKKQGVKLETPVAPIPKENRFGGEYLNRIIPN